MDRQTFKQNSSKPHTINEKKKKKKEKKKKRKKKEVFLSGGQTDIRSTQNYSSEPHKKKFFIEFFF